jgi:hypothetical protein
MHSPARLRSTYCCARRIFRIRSEDCGSQILPAIPTWAVAAFA